MCVYVLVVCAQVPTLLANCTPTQLNILFTAPADCFPNMFRGPAIYILREQRILRVRAFVYCPFVPVSDGRARFFLLHDGRET